MTELLPSGAPSKEFDPDSKFKRLGRGNLLAPSCCSSCGSSDSERQYLDLGLFIDYYGQVYFCTICVEEMAETIGLLNSTEIEFLNRLNERYTIELAELKTAYEADHAKLEHFTALFGNVTGFSPSDIISDSVNETDEQESTSDVELIEQSGEEQSDFNESIEGEGLTDSLRSERNNGSGLDL